MAQGQRATRSLGDLAAPVAQDLTRAGQVAPGGEQPAHCGCGKWPASRAVLSGPRRAGGKDQGRGPPGRAGATERRGVTPGGPRLYDGGIISMIKENPIGCLNPEMVHQLWTHWQQTLEAKLMPDYFGSDL